MIDVTIFMKHKLVIKMMTHDHWRQVGFWPTYIHQPTLQAVNVYMGVHFKLCPENNPQNPMITAMGNQPAVGGHRSSCGGAFR